MCICNILYLYLGLLWKYLTALSIVPRDFSSKSWRSTSTKVTNTRHILIHIPRCIKWVNFNKFPPVYVSNQDSPKLPRKCAHVCIQKVFMPPHVGEFTLTQILQLKQQVLSGIFSLCRERPNHRNLLPKRRRSSWRVGPSQLPRLSKLKKFRSVQRENVLIFQFGIHPEEGHLATETNSLFLEEPKRHEIFHDIKNFRIEQFSKDSIAPLNLDVLCIWNVFRWGVHWGGNAQRACGFCTCQGSVSAFGFPTEMNRIL